MRMLLTGCSYPCPMSLPMKLLTRVLRGTVCELLKPRLFLKGTNEATSLVSIAGWDKPKNLRIVKSERGSAKPKREEGGRPGITPRVCIRPRLSPVAGA